MEEVNGKRKISFLGVTRKSEVIKRDDFVYLDAAADKQVLFYHLVFADKTKLSSKDFEYWKLEQKEISDEY